MAELYQRLRDRGWRMTNQRRAVARVFAGDMHLTAEQVFDQARLTLPDISKATVYNTLTELVQMGELDELVVSRGPRLFDSNVSRPHHHAHCRVCGGIRDISLPESLEVSLHLAAGTTVHAARVILEGDCPTCCPSGDSSSDSP